MRTFALLISVGIVTLGGATLARAQGNPVQARLARPFPTLRDTRFR